MFSDDARIDDATADRRPRSGGLRGPGRAVGACLAAAVLMAASAAPAASQGLDGQYRIRIDGTSQRLDQEADAEDFSGAAALRAVDSDGWIAFEIEARDAPLPGGRFEGRASGGTFAATWQQAGAGESAIVRGKIANGQMFKATLIWTADGAARLVEATLLGRRMGPARGQVAAHGPEEGAQPSEAAARIMDALERGDPGQVQVPTDPGNRRRFPDMGQGGGEEPGGEAGGDEAQGEDDAGTLDVDFRTVMFMPEAPLAGEPVSVLVRADPPPGGQQVERIEVFVATPDGLETLTSQGNIMDQRLPSLAAGSYDVHVEAVGPDGARSRTVERTLRIQGAGNAVVRGRITGNTAIVTGVRIVTLEGGTVASTELDSSGRYRLDGLPAGDYRLIVNHPGGRIEPRSQMNITLDGRSTYERDFTARR